MFEHVCSRVLRGSTVALLACSVLIASPALSQTPKAALIRDVDNAALQPFRAHIGVYLGQSEGSKTVDGPTVPAGKRLVIENVSVWGVTTGADTITGVWLSVPGTTPNFVLLDPTTAERKPSGGAGSIVAYNRLVKLYFSPGELIQAEVFVSGTEGGSRQVNIYLHGYLVNLP